MAKHWPDLENIYNEVIVEERFVGLRIGDFRSFWQVELVLKNCIQFT